MSELRYQEDAYRVRTGFGSEITVKALVPEKPNGAAVVLAHGLANDLDFPLLVRTAEEAAKSGFTAVRFNFPYREAGLDQVDSLDSLLDAFIRICRDTHDRFAIAPDRLFLGGKSLGARIAAQAAGEGLPAAGLVFLGFPLQPPGHPEKSRASFIEAVRHIPQLFFAGTRDPLCPLSDLKQVLEKVPQASLDVVDGGDHSFVPPEDDERALDEIYEGIARAAADWLMTQARGVDDEE